MCFIRPDKLIGNLQISSFMEEEKGLTKISQEAILVGKKFKITIYLDRSTPLTGEEVNKMKQSLLKLRDYVIAFKLGESYKSLKINEKEFIATEMNKQQDQLNPSFSKKLEKVNQLQLNQFFDHNKTTKEIEIQVIEEPLTSTTAKEKLLEKIDNPLKGPLHFFKRIINKTIEFASGKDLRRRHSNMAHIALNAEHMGKGANLGITASHVNKQLLQHKDHLAFVDGAPINFLEEYDQYAKLANDFGLNKTDSKTANSKTFQRLLKLKNHECVIFPVNTSSHAMLGMIVKEGNDRYTYYHFNSGKGIDRHANYIKNGVKYTQQSLIQQDWNKEEAMTFVENLAFLTGEFPRVETIYSIIDNIRIRNEGRIKEVELSKESQAWDVGQTGYSCTGGAHKALLKHVLKSESYQYIDVELRKNAVFKMYSKMAAGLISSYASKVATLEMIQTLEKQGLESDHELAKIKKNIEEVTNKSRHFKQFSAVSKTVFGKYRKIAKKKTLNDIEVLQAAYYHLASGNYEKARNILISQYDQISDKHSDAQKKDIKELVEVMKTIVKSENSQYMDNRLAAIDIEYGIYATILKALPDNEWPDFLKEISGRLYMQSQTPHIYSDSPWKSSIATLAQNWYDKEFKKNHP